MAVGLIAEPDAPMDLARYLAEELEPELRRRHPGLGWRFVVAEEAGAPADVIGAARDRLLDENWDLAIRLTNLPLSEARRPVVAQASAAHSVGVVSVPALGAVNVRRRGLPVVADLVDRVAGMVDEAPDEDDRRRGSRRLRELAEEPGEFRVSRLVTGNITLLAGMIRANRPWRLAIRLTRALTAALAAGAFALVTPDMWLLADAYGGVRLTAIAVVSMLAFTLTLIVGGKLWERARRPGQRRQVALFNITTTVTVVSGVLALYAVLFVLAVLLAFALVVPGLFGASLGHPARFSDYLELAFLTSSLATVGGALGAGLESDDAVHEAAYTYHRAG
ncbi:hypothetical protein GCM10009539_08300 [Cryptosporangium japonicum]|uniref:Uncharacterized protein n=1 Tax=Cryptosporangium japonicum TaxID=80872 RepID=A0ABN0TMD7_9ACTN